MGVFHNNNGSLERIAGGTLYADNPIGTILAFGGSDIPTGWHLCDGTAVSRTTYADLFSVIGTSFGTGDGSTTFNLPDLRGEFLRGAGTNSHADQGNGGNVGEHQNATKIPYLTYDADAHLFWLSDYDTSKNIKQRDNTILGTSSKPAILNASYNQDVQERIEYATPRPTNTSVNYIIKMFKVGLPADFTDNGHEYSTSEKVVGEWIDGKPVYEKSAVFTNNTGQSSFDSLKLNISNIDTVIKFDSVCIGNNKAVYNSPHYNPDGTNDYLCVWYRPDLDYVRYYRGSYPSTPFTLNITIRYTKTTDPVKLPSEYQRIEYLEATGTQYINTGLVTNAGWRIKSNVLLTANETKYNTFWGSVGLSGSPFARSGVAVATISENNVFHVGAGAAMNSNISCTAGTIYAVEANNFTNNNPVLTVNDATATFTNIGSGSGFSSLANYLFACNSAEKGGAVDCWKGRIYGHFYVYDSSNDADLIADFVPCRRKSDDVLGMYDLIRQTFYTNAGTGTFIAGPDVN